MFSISKNITNNSLRVKGRGHRSENDVVPVGANRSLTFACHDGRHGSDGGRRLVAAAENPSTLTLKGVNPMDLHYPLAGLTVFVGGIVFMKGFDFLAAESVRRLLEMAGRSETETTANGRRVS